MEITEYKIPLEVDSQEKMIGEGTIAGQILRPEEAELAKLGYKQEFKREFGWISTFSFAFSISGLLATVSEPSLKIRGQFYLPRLIGIGYFDMGVSIGCWGSASDGVVLVMRLEKSALMAGLSEVHLVCVLQLA